MQVLFCAILRFLRASVEYHAESNQDQSVRAGVCHLASFRAPDAHGVVSTARHNLAAVGRYGHSGNRASVPLEHLEHLLRDTINQPTNRSRKSNRHQSGNSNQVDWPQGNLTDTQSSRIRQTGRHLASCRSPDTHGVVVTARHNLVAVGGYGHSAHSASVPLEHLQHLNTKQTQLTFDAVGFRC